MSKKARSPHFEKIIQQHQLGAYRTHYGSDRPFPVAGVSAMSVGLLLGGAFASLTPFLLTILLFWQVAIVPLLALTWIAGGIWLISSSLKNGTKMVIVCEKGLLCLTRRVWEPIFWHEIAAIWYGTPDATDASRCKVDRTDGYSFDFDNTLPRAEYLKRLLEREVLHRLFAHCLNQYRRGILLSFGPINISQEGICVQPQKHLLPWCQLKYIDALDDMLYIRLKHQSSDIASLSLLGIPNLCVLESLIRHIHRVHREAFLQQEALIPKRPRLVRQKTAAWKGGDESKETALVL